MTPSTILTFEVIMKLFFSNDNKISTLFYYFQLNTLLHDGMNDCSAKLIYVKKQLMREY